MGREVRRKMIEEARGHGHCASYMSACRSLSVLRLAEIGSTCNSSRMCVQQRAQSEDAGMEQPSGLRGDTYPRLLRRGEQFTHRHIYAAFF